MTSQKQLRDLASTAIKKVLFPFVYPPVCLTCDNFCRDPELNLCDSCVDLLELLIPSERCPQCFSLIDPFKTTGCGVCAKLRHPFSGLASAFESSGPPALLIGQLKCRKHEFIAKSLAACLVIQFDSLGWPLPDVVMSFPFPIVEKIFKGSGAGELIAREAADFLGRPYVQGLVNARQIYLKPSVKIQDKTVLLIDDAIKSVEMLTACGRSLLEGYPKRLYALTACLNPSFYSEINKHN